MCRKKKKFINTIFFPWKSKKVVNHRFFLHESTGAFDCVWSRSWYIYTLRGDWLWDLHVYTRRRKQSYRCGSSGWKGEHELCLLMSKVGSCCRVVIVLKGLLKEQTLSCSFGPDVTLFLPLSVFSCVHTAHSCDKNCIFE